MFSGSYTLEGGKGVQGEGGTSRVKAVSDLFASVGGKMESFHFTFGADDYVIIGELPDNAAAASAALKVGTTGAVNNRTTVLLTPEEMDAATKLSPTYRAP